MMSKINQASIIIFAMLYPDKLDRCLATLRASKNLELDVKVLMPAGMKEKKEELRALLGKGNVLTVKGSNSEGISGQFRELIGSCSYENVFFLPSDTIFESFTLETACESQKTADCTIFNVAVINQAVRISSILYDRSSPEENLLLEESGGEGGTTLASIYQHSPNIWNQAYRKSILLNNGPVLHDITRAGQYLFLSSYHAHCRSIAFRPMTFIYRNGLAAKEVPSPGFCIKRRWEIRRMLHMAQSHFPEDALSMLHREFTVSPSEALQFSAKKIKDKGSRK